ncbi:MAG: DNA-binding response regulator [Pseudomonadota bacterium]|jgi:two-component system phosphate regulon response regulator OmpR
MKIMIVEDHESLRETMVEYLAKQGYSIISACNADEMDELLSKDEFQLLILDLQLPGEDGISIAKRLKNSKKNLRIIMLTARSGELDVLEGYKTGADIYLTKPATPELLAAAIERLSSRVVVNESNVIQFEIQSMTLQGQSLVHLTKLESVILKGLLEASGQMLPHTRLMDLAGMDSTPRGKANLEVQLTRLRKKLVSAGVPAPAIKAIRYRGYQLLSNISMI